MKSVTLASYHPRRIHFTTDGVNLYKARDLFVSFPIFFMNVFVRQCVINCLLANTGEYLSVAFILKFVYLDETDL